MLRFFVQRPVAVTMIYAAVFLLGLISLGRLKVSLFPDIVFPRVTVLTPYSNVAPGEIENLVTRPVEDALSSVAGIKKIVSRSQEGLSIVEATLDWGTSLDLAVINIRQKVDLAKTVLPQDAGKSIIVKFDPAADPVVILVARPVELPFEKTRDYIEKNVRPFFERINGVASLSVLGGLRREIQVRVDSRRLYALGLTIEEISRSLSASNFSFPAGNVRKGTNEFNVRVQGRFTSVDDIRKTVVTVGESGAPVYLSRLAEVVDDFRERRGASYHNGEPAVIIGLKKEPGRNTIDTVARIRAELLKINRRFERTIKFEIIQDRSLYISNAISELRNAALLGAFIAFLVLFIFLKDIRAAGIVVLSIPAAILATFFLMFAFGLSLNIMSLGGLALGIGMLVDNAIVVLESIFAERENNPGTSSTETALNGARSVIGAVSASTLTSIVVFVPIIFVAGIAGEVFRDLALTVTFSLLSSLLCSISLIPMLASLEPAANGRIDNLFRTINRLGRPMFLMGERLVESLTRVYSRAIGASLRRPLPILAASAIAAVVGILLFWFVPRSLFPNADQGIVYAEFRLPGGTGMEDSERVQKRIHRYLKENKLAVHAVTNIGFEPDDLASRIKGVRKANYAEHHFYLDTRKQSSAEFIRQLDAALEKTLNAKRSFRVKGDALQELLGESGRNLLIDIESRDRRTARRAASWMLKRIRKAPWLVNVRSSATAGDPELRLSLDRTKIASAGLTPAAVAGVVRTAIQGSRATAYREGDQEFDVRVRLQEKDRRHANQIRRLFVRPPKGAPTEIGDLLSTAPALGYSTMLRRNQRRLERLRIEYKPGEEQAAREFLAGLLQEARVRFASLGDKQPELSLAADNQETIDSLKNLLYAFLLSTVLIYQLLASQFESFLHPLTLALSIPLMLIGVSGSLLITGHSLNISSAIGMIMLVGIVVNAAIVLYEKIQQNRADSAFDRERLPEILIQSGQERLRPILLTTITTLLGLLPMALGLGSGGGLQAPMAVVVIGGLTVSSVLTLVAFPTLYLLFERARW